MMTELEIVEKLATVTEFEATFEVMELDKAGPLAAVLKIDVDEPALIAELVPKAETGEPPTITSELDCTTEGRVATLEIEVKVEDDKSGLVEA